MARRSIAILPGIQPHVAPIDPTLGGARFDQPGRTITILADIPGGPKAGTYTLLPGSYATLPGAYRVEASPSSGLDLAAGSIFGAADGRYLVAAVSGYDGTSIRSGIPQTWSVMSEQTWRRYTEVVSSGGNEFFAQLARTAGFAPPPLPEDAGRLALNVTNALALNASLRSDAAFGRGGQVDIAAPKIAVASSPTGIGADYLVMTPESIGNLKASSVLLGGIRSGELAGDRVTIKASDILVADQRHQRPGQSRADPDGQQCGHARARQRHQSRRRRAGW